MQISWSLGWFSPFTSPSAGDMSVQSSGSFQKGICVQGHAPRACVQASVCWGPGVLVRAPGEGSRDPAGSLLATPGQMSQAVGSPSPTLLPCQGDRDASGSWKPEKGCCSSPSHGPSLLGPSQSHRAPRTKLEGGTQDPRCSALKSLSWKCDHFSYQPGDPCGTALEDPEATRQD